MLQTKRALLFLLCFAFLGSLHAFATSDGPDYYRVTGVTANDVLNIRAAPAASGAKIGTIPYDSTGIANLGCVGGLTYAEWEKATDDERSAALKTRWCRVGYDRTIGWVAGWFLTESDADDHFRAGDALSDIAGSGWQLRDFSGEAPGAEAWISFKSDNTVVGSGGCNNFSGMHTPGKGAPLFSPIAATRMMCPEPQMQTETRLFQVLDEAREMVSYQLVMALFDGSGTLLATFTRSDSD
jgi:heat shock protein HslJ